MEKKKYRTPQAKVLHAISEQLLADSNGVTGTGVGDGIGYGGTDDEGTLDPSAKTTLQLSSVWDD